VEVTTTTTSSSSTAAIVSNDKTIIIIITTRNDMLRVIDDFMVEVQIVWNRGTIISAMNW